MAHGNASNAFRGFASRPRRAAASTKVPPAGNPSVEETAESIRVDVVRRANREAGGYGA